MEGNIKNMTSAFKPGGKAPQSMVVFQEQDFMSAISQAICRSETTKAGTYYYDIVFIVYLRKWNRHKNNNLY